MRISALFVTAVVIGGLAGSTASAQTGSPRSASAATMRAQTRSGTTRSPRKAPEMPTQSNLRKTNQKKSYGKIPLPPPLTGHFSAGQGASLKALSSETMFLIDPVGRKDPSGTPVQFYPSSRSLPAGNNQATAGKTYTAKLRENGDVVKRK
jgi:hypothetical protein